MKFSKKIISVLILVGLFAVLTCCENPILTKAQAPDNYRWVAHNSGLPSGGDIIGIAVDKNNANTIYALSQSGGVLKTTDGGSNWATANNGLPDDKNSKWSGLGTNLLTMDPSNSSILYAVFNGKIYKTADGAANWTGAYAGTMLTTNYSTAGVIVDPTNSSHLFAGTIVDNSIGGVFESNNGGISWTQIAGTGIGNGYGANDAWPMAIDPSDENNIYFAAIHNENMKSTDGGASWTSFVIPSAFTQTANGGNNIAIQPTTHKIFISFPSGMIASADGVNFTEVSTFSEQYVTSVKFASSNPEIVYATTKNGKIYRSANSGVDWSLVNTTAGNQWLSLEIDPSNTDLLYLGSVGKGIYTSTNGGDTVNPINNGISLTPSIYAISQSSSNPSVLYAGVSGVGLYRSTDGGYSWNYRSNQGSFTLAIDPTDPDILLSDNISNNGDTALYRSTDGGITWASVVASDPSPYVYWSTLAFAQSDHNVVYAGDSVRILKSTNGGQSFQEVSFFNGKGVSMGNIVVDGKNPDVAYVAMDDEYVYKTTDGGGSWQQLNASNGLGAVNSAYSVSVDPRNGNNVYVGMYDLANYAYDRYYRSTDGGQNFTKVVDLKDYRTERPRLITFDASDPNIVYGYGAGVSYDGSDGVALRSTDGGSTWGAVPTTGLTTNTPIVFGNAGKGGEIIALDNFQGIVIYENDIPKFDQSVFSVSNANGKSSYQSGDTLNLSLVVSNTGPAKASGTVVEITMPSGTSYINNSLVLDNNTVNPDLSGNTLSINTVDLGYSDKSYLNLQAKIGESFFGNTTIRAKISSDEDVSGTYLPDLAVAVLAIAPSSAPATDPAEIQTPAPASSSSSSSNSSCGNQAPTFTPDLFQVNTTGTKATLYFAPAGMPYDNYVIRFGPTANNLLYSASFSRGFAGGVIYYTVNELSPNTTYYFQVRAGNGCMPGNWGNTVSAKTTGNVKSTATYYKSFGGFVKSLVNAFTPKYTGPVIINPIPATGNNPKEIPVQQKTNNTVQPIQQTNQTSTPTPKKKTCFFFICW